MAHLKSNSTSIEHRLKGNEHFAKKKYFLAAISYNQAICNAETKELRALAYANRSALDMSSKEYKLALKDIQWALDNEYPADKIQKLLDRREKCLKFFESMEKDPNDTIDNFYKLSYPANPKIPFIIDGLELRIDGKFGRGIFATRDLKLGDIISIEEPVLYKLTKLGPFAHCCNCLKSNKMSLIPCLKFASFMFCSEECRDEIYSKFNIDDFWIENLVYDCDASRFALFLYTYMEAFGGPGGLNKFATENDFKNWNKTIFDYDLSNPNDPSYKQNLLKSILSFYSPDTYEEVLKTHLKEVDKMRDIRLNNVKMPLVMDLMKQICVVFESSAMHIHNRVNIHERNEKLFESLKNERDHHIEDIQLHPFTPLINYSCYPNVEKLVYNGRVAHYVVRPIKAGEELFRNPGHPLLFELPVEKRREFLKTYHFYSCKCFYCENGLTIFNLPPPTYIFMKYILHGPNVTAKEMLKQIKDTWKIMEKCYKDEPNGSKEAFCSYTSMDMMMGFVTGKLEEQS